MRRVHLLEGQVRDRLRHAAAQVRREGGVAEGLDEEHRRGDALVEDRELFLVVDFARAVPVDF